jgi:ADP-ribose pyrophosphatase YjhB (NUDIX family)
VKRRLMVPVLRLFGLLPESVRHRVIGWSSPAFRVGTVGVVRDGNRILLARHSYRPGWSLPGGMLGWRETPLGSVVRELREECGVATEAVASAVPVFARAPRRVVMAFPMRLAAGVDPSEVRAASPEIVEVAWFTPAELPEISRTTRLVLDAWPDLEG